MKCIHIDSVMARAIVYSHGVDKDGCVLTYATDLNKNFGFEERKLGIKHTVYVFINNHVGHLLMTKLFDEGKNDIIEMFSTKNTVRVTSTFSFAELMEENDNGDIIVDSFMYGVKFHDDRGAKMFMDKMRNCYKKNLFYMHPKESEEMMVFENFISRRKTLMFPFDYSELTMEPFYPQRESFQTLGEFIIHSDGNMITNIKFLSSDILKRKYQTCPIVNITITTTNGTFLYGKDNCTEMITISMLPESIPSIGFIRESQHVRFTGDSFVTGSEREILEMFVHEFYTINTKIFILALSNHVEMFVFMIERMVYMGILDDLMQKYTSFKDAVKNVTFNKLSPCIEIEPFIHNHLLLEDYLASLQQKLYGYVYNDWDDLISYNFGIGGFNTFNVIPTKREVYRRLVGVEVYEFATLPFIMKEIVKWFRGFKMNEFYTKLNDLISLSETSMISLCKLNKKTLSRKSKNLLVRHFLEHEFVLVPRPFQRRGRELYGGFTFAKAGIYNSTVQFDFSSYYPSIVVALNLSFWKCALVKRGTCDRGVIIPFDKDESYDVVFYTGEEFSYIPTVASAISSIKGAPKGERKALANSLLGEFGNERSPYYSPDFYNIVTFVGRKLVQYTASLRFKATSIWDILSTNCKLDTSVVKVDTDGFTVCIDNDGSELLKQINDFLRDTVSPDVSMRIERSRNPIIIFHSKSCIYHDGNPSLFCKLKDMTLPPKSDDELETKKIKALIARSLPDPGCPQNLTTRNGFIAFCHNYSTDELVVLGKFRETKQSIFKLKYIELMTTK